MTSTLRLTLAALLVLVSLLLAGLLLIEHRPAFLSGLVDPFLGLALLLALLWLGIWGGRLGGDAMWAPPWGLLVGLLLGFLLATPQSPDPVLQAIVHMLGAVSVLLLVAGEVMVLRLPLRQIIGLALLVGACHGFLHGMGNTFEQVVSFHIGALISAAALLVMGSVLGRGLTHRTGGSSPAEPQPWSEVHTRRVQQSSPQCGLGLRLHRPAVAILPPRDPWRVSAGAGGLALSPLG